MIKNIENTIDFAKSIILELMLVIVEGGVQKVQKNKEKNLGFIKFKSEAQFRENITKIKPLFSRFDIEHRLHPEAPFGIHVLNFSDQGQKIYALYEEAVIQGCDNLFNELPQYNQGGSVRSGGVTTTVIPHVASQEENVLFVLRNSMLTYDSVSKFLIKHADLSPRALLLNAQVLYQNGQKLEAFAWYTVAKVRSYADSLKCTDQSCSGPAVQLVYEFPGQLGEDLYKRWVGDIEKSVGHKALACSLYKQYPQTNHEPTWLADQGMRSFASYFGEESSEALQAPRFFPKEKCLEAEREALKMLEDMAGEEGAPPSYAESTQQPTRT